MALQAAAWLALSPPLHTTTARRRICLAHPRDCELLLGIYPAGRQLCSGVPSQRAVARSPLSPRCGSPDTVPPAHPHIFVACSSVLFASSCRLLLPLARARVRECIFQKLSTLRIIRYTLKVCMVDKCFSTSIYRFSIMLIIRALKIGHFIYLLECLLSTFANLPIFHRSITQDLRG